MNDNEMALLNNLIMLTEAIAAAKARIDCHDARIANLENPGILVCRWIWLDEDCWLGECGARWSFPDGTPTDNAMQFCPVCGGRLVQVSQ